MTSLPPQLSVVVPCYCDAAILPETHRRLRAVLDATGRRHEIIYVDDGSPDGTRGALRALYAGDPGHVVMLGLARNFGQHAAISAGLAVARGEVVVTIDSDLETPPEEIPKLIDALADGADIACGKRAARDQSAVRALGSRVISGAAGERVHDPHLELIRELDGTPPRPMGRVRDLLLRMQGIAVLAEGADHESSIPHGGAESRHMRGIGKQDRGIAMTVARVVPRAELDRGEPERSNAIQRLLEGQVLEENREDPELHGVAATTPRISGSTERDR